MIQPKRTVTALSLVAGAAVVFLFSVMASRAETPFGSREDAAELAVLPSPVAPWKGAPLRVIFAAERPSKTRATASRISRWLTT